MTHVNDPVEIDCNADRARHSVALSARRQVPVIARQLQRRLRDILSDLNAMPDNDRIRRHLAGLMTIVQVSSMCSRNAAVAPP